MKTALAVLLAGVVLALGADEARADATPEQKATAQALFDKARDLALHKNFSEACPKFAESLRIDPGLGTMLWLADCYENNGQTASAWAQFREAASAAAVHKDPREAVARRRVAALEPKLARLVVTTPRETPVRGLEVRRDGIAIASAELGVAVPVDPGIHAISATAPGRKPWSANVDVRPAAPLVVTVPVLAEDEEVSAAPSPMTASSPVTAAASPPPEARPSPALRIVGLSAAVAGVVGLGLGAGLGLAAKSANDASDADGHCLPDNECDATGKDKRQQAQHLATGSTVAFVAGGVLAAGGLALFFLAPKTKRTGLVVVPILDASQGGVLVRRSF